MRQPTLGKRLKHEIHFSFNSAPTVYTDTIAFVPFVCVVTNYGNKAKATLTGRSISGGAPRSAAFNLFGYSHKASPPDWLVPLIREAGYEGSMPSDERVTYTPKHRKS